ncbi:hypothetical protein E1B28_000236 [Marasmius oreades]|uniref:Secreted protein n=1 Tax=Marasmius oreades TaxID=181124 RepID=A0A9P7V0W3_9AGAR|nr:uncharacterized protein E1B28_000236 [Marasmius oreades]KAG7098274.1 hypothetical protein E1B28_000236 [Marasmius oreades]
MKLRILSSLGYLILCRWKAMSDVFVSTYISTRTKSETLLVSEIVPADPQKGSTAMGPASHPLLPQAVDASRGKRRYSHHERTQILRSQRWITGYRTPEAEGLKTRHSALLQAQPPTYRF